jgi:O-antigen/teichoic acid export membrane protein
VTKHKTLTSLSWVALLRYSNRSIDFLRIIILARILTPSDFGLFSIATITINILESISDTGFSYAFIHHQGNIRKYAKTLFVVNAIRGLLLSIISFCLSFILAGFFSQPTLLPFMMLLSLTPFIKGLQNPSIIMFQKEMNFKGEYLLKLIPTAFTAITSIYLSTLLHSALALVAGVIIGACTETILSYILCKTHFDEPFSKKRFNKLFSFGKSMTIGGSFSFLMTQVDNIFIGKFFGVSSLGQYDVLFKLGSVAFSEVTDIVSRVMFPLFATLQKKQDLLRKMFIKNVYFVLIPSGAITLLLLLFPKQIILLTFGDQWISSTLLLQVLALYGFLRSSIGPIGPLFLAVGKPSLLTRANFINFFMIVLLIYPFAIRYGLVGVALAMTTAYVLSSVYLVLHVVTYFRKNAIK